jgi:hypothetical protein
MKERGGVEPSAFHSELIDFLVKADLATARIESLVIKPGGVDN